MKSALMQDTKLQVHHGTLSNLHPMTLSTLYVCIPTTKERRPRLANCISSIHENAGYPHCIVTYENEGEGFCGPIHRILTGFSYGTLVWCIGDDSILTEPDTIKRLVLRLKQAYPDFTGVVQPDDGIQHGRIATMPLCAASTMLQYTHKGYFLNFADNEATERLIAKGKYLYCPEIYVDHQHAVVGKATNDRTYQAGQAKYAEDQALYHQRQIAGYPEK